MTPDVRRREVDAIVVGMGWAGGIVAAELARAGLRVVGLERGPDRSLADDEFTRKHDELRFRVRTGLMQDVAAESWTFRHDLRETALPFRRLGAFLPGTGVGGSGGHYGGSTARFAPWEFETRSRTIARYGEAAIPEDSTIQDWGVTYDDLEPAYDRFERMAGVGGEADPFGGPRSRDYPLPAPRPGAATSLFADACRGLGLRPHVMPLAVLSQPYVNPDGVARGACTYCGDCTHHACAVDARADSRVTVLPFARSTGRFELRAHANVFRVLHDGGRASGVWYRDRAGRVVEQRADIVVLAAYALNNVRLLLLSGLGRPYDPVSGRGVVGRNYAYNVHAAGTAFFRDRRFRHYIGAGAGGFGLSDFAADHFDHSGLGFIGGVQMQVAPGGAPIASQRVPPGTPRWGAGWRRALRDWYDRSLTVSALGNVLAYRTNMLDLDPTYRDAWGSPLLRITFDWHENELRIARFAAERIREILEATRPDHLTVHADEGHFDSARYQGTHNTGGAIMGADPATSVVDPGLRMWDCENVWVVGGSAFPQNGTPGPTGTICALAYRAADCIVRTYARRPEGT